MTNPLNAKMKPILWTLCFLAVITTCVFIIYTSKHHVDEGWYHNLAYSNNVNGYPSFNAFADIPVFQGYYASGSGFMTRIYRIAIDLVANDSNAIRLIRLMMAFAYFVSLWIYFGVCKFSKEAMPLIFIFVLFNPIAIITLSIARPEIILSSIFLWILIVLKSEMQSVVKVFCSLSLAYIATTIHANGMIALCFIGLYLIFFRHTWKIRSIGFVLILGIFVLQYYSRIRNIVSPVENIRSVQFNAMFMSGDEQKIMRSISELPKFILGELERYQISTFPHTISHVLRIILVTIPYGVFYVMALLKPKMIKGEDLLFVISSNLMFVVVGNKTYLYLVYMLPIVVLYLFRFIQASPEKVKRVVLALAVLLILVNPLFLIVKHYTQIKDESAISDYVKKSGIEVIYAPLSYSPYLAGEDFLCTTQKTKNQMMNNVTITDDKLVIIGLVDSGFDMALSAHKLYKEEVYLGELLRYYELN